MKKMHLLTLVFFSMCINIYAQHPSITFVNTTSAPKINYFYIDKDLNESKKITLINNYDSCSVEIKITTDDEKQIAIKVLEFEKGTKIMDIDSLKYIYNSFHFGGFPKQITLTIDGGKEISLKITEKFNKFIPSLQEETSFLKMTESPNMEFPQTYNSRTRFLYEYNFAAEDPVTFSNVRRGIIRKHYHHPVYGRNMLVVFKNYHPYRDSIALGISYNDKFMESASTFNDAFNKTKGTENPINGLDNPGAMGLVDVDKLILFQKLASELKEYYQKKLSTPMVDTKVIRFGVDYINKNMNTYLGITNFSAQGITDRATDIIAENPDEDAKEIITQAREAAYYYSKIINYKIFDSHSIQIQNKDEIQLEVTRYVNGVKVGTTEEAKKTFNIRGGIKADFSLGLFATGLIDKSYTSVAVAHPDTSYFTTSNGVVNRDSIVGINSAATRDSIIKDNKGTFNVGPAVLAHFYYRTGTNLNFAATIGFSLNLQATPRYLIGLSALIGRDSRLVLSGGLAMGQYKDLASGLSEGQKIKLSSYANSTLPTKDVWGYNWFVSISWNFAGVALGGTK